MSIEQFPEIETFQKLPHRVIVKGGSSGLNSKGRAELRGIVINNVGQPIRHIKVFLVIFDEQDLPILNKSTTATPDSLPQGAIGSFTFAVDGHGKEITNYYLYANWKYDDTNW
jgi:hypothetical protein